MKGAAQKKLTLASFSLKDIAQGTKIALVIAALAAAGAGALGAMAIQTSKAAQDSLAAGRSVRDYFAMVTDAPASLKVSVALNGPWLAAADASLDALAQSANSVLLPSSVKEDIRAAYSAAKAVTSRLKRSGSAGASDAGAALAAVPAASRAAEQLVRIGSAGAGAGTLQMAALACLILVVAAGSYGLRRVMAEFRDRFNAAMQQFRVEERATVDVVHGLREIAQDGGFGRLQVEGGTGHSAHLVKAVNAVLDAALQVASETQEALQHGIGSAGKAADAARQSTSHANAGAKAASDAQGNMSQLVVEATNLSADLRSIAIDADSLKDRSEEASFSVQGCISKLDAMRQGLTESAKRVKGLGEHAQQLAMLGTSIAEVAEQAQVLALNAALAAERAGDHGSGITVVSNHLELLAARTREVADRLVASTAGAQSEARIASEVIDGSVAHLVSGSQELAISATLLAAMPAVSASCSATSTRLNARADHLLSTAKGLVSGLGEASSALATSSTLSAEVAAAVERVASLVQDAAQGLPEATA